MEEKKVNSVVEEVVQQITNMVQSGRFSIGDKLPSEPALMSELQVSRNSIREAMKMLSAVGVVDVRRGDGTYICNSIEPSYLDIAMYNMMFASSSQESIVELRQAVDEMVLSIVMNKCTEEDLAILQEYINKMRAGFIHDEIDKAAENDLAFHYYLAKRTENPFIERMVRSVYKLFEGSIAYNLRNHKVFAQADRIHQDILECLRKKDRVHIHDVITDSLFSWKSMVKMK